MYKEASISPSFPTNTSLLEFELKFFQLLTHYKVMKFTAFGSIFALALVGVVAAAGIPGQDPNTGKTPAKNTQTGTTTPNSATKDQCVQSDCKCDGKLGNFCGNTAVANHCVTGHLYTCHEDGTTCDLGLNDSCKN